MCGLHTPPHHTTHHHTPPHHTTPHTTPHHQGDIPSPQPVGHAPFGGCYPLLTLLRLQPWARGTSHSPGLWASRLFGPTTPPRHSIGGDLRHRGTSHPPGLWALRSFGSTAPCIDSAPKRIHCPLPQAVWQCAEGYPLPPHI